MKMRAHAGVFRMTYAEHPFSSDGSIPNRSSCAALSPSAVFRLRWWLA